MPDDAVKTTAVTQTAAAGPGGAAQPAADATRPKPEPAAMRAAAPGTEAAGAAKFDPRRWWTAWRAARARAQAAAAAVGKSEPSLGAGAQPDPQSEPKSDPQPDPKSAAAGATAGKAATSLFGVLDAEERIRASAERSERILWLSAAAVTLLYASMIASQAVLGAAVFLSEPEKERRGQDAPPGTISVEIVPEPDRNAKTKRWREGAETLAPEPSETPPQQPQMAALPQPEVPEAAPTKDPREAKDEPRPEGAPMLLDLESLVDAAAADLNRQIDRAFSQKPKKRQEERQAVYSGGTMKVRGTGATGKSDAFTRSVIAALMKTRPGPFALWGRVLVSFEVSESGKLKYVHLLHSSGNSALDDAAVAAIRKARFERPPPGLTADQRTYIIDYIFG